MRRAAALVLALVVAGGCGGSSPELLSGTTSPAPTSSGPPVSGSLPTGMGTTVMITSKGFQPHELLAPMGFPIVWKNVSDTTQSVNLDNFSQPVDSGPIKPGKSWSFNPDAQLSILYHSTYPGHFQGKLQVQLVGNS